MFFSAYFFQFKSKDFIDEILMDDNLDEALKFEKLLADDILIKQEPEELSVADMRDRQKKDNHNMSKYDVYSMLSVCFVSQCDHSVIRSISCVRHPIQRECWKFILITYENTRIAAASSLKFYFYIQRILVWYLQVDE